jgi:hypothetical protein
MAGLCDIYTLEHFEAEAIVGVTLVSQEEMDLAEQLFIENNELRARLDEIEKSLHAKVCHIDVIEEELWTLKSAQGISAIVST